MNFMQIILTPFVWILMFFYNIFSNYGIALILFAFVVKLVLFPFSLKGKRGMIQMNMMQGKLAKLQKQYGKDKDRYNVEVQKLYEKEHVNPMGGCLWMMLPMLVLFPLYAIVREPLTYMMSMNLPEQFAAVAQAVNWDSVALSMGWVKQGATAFTNVGFNQLYLASLITPQNVGAVQAAVGEGVKVLALNFEFLGVNLSQIPTWKFWINGIDWPTIGLFLLPVISAISSVLFSIVSMKTNAINQQAKQNTSNNMMMMLMSPIMSLWIGFTMPASLCIYWIAQNIFSLLQELVASMMLKKDYAKAAEAAAKREEEEKEEEKREKELERQERARRIEEAKLNKGKKQVEKKSDEDKIPATVKEASRVGIRTYARGRAYDPLRFNPDGPTAYRDPDGPARPAVAPEALAVEPEPKTDDTEK